MDCAAAAAAETSRRRRNVSHDVIPRILLHLPVKSLLRLRCVSKAWRSLISDPEFTQSHRRRSQSQRNPLLLTIPKEEDDGSGLSIFALTDNGAVEKYATFPDVFTAKKNAAATAAARIWSSPDLLCVRQGNRCTLLNPTTREQAVLSAIPPPARPSNSLRAFSPFELGFGYVPAAGRFKVVKIFIGATKAPEGIMEVCCDVLTVGVDRSWRLAEDPPFLLEAGPPVVVGGVVYKMGKEEGVAAFDLEGEAWRVVPLPTGVPFRGYCSYVLCGMRESLYLSLLSLNQKRLQLWELTSSEAGNWARKYSVDCSAFPIIDSCKPVDFSPVAMRGDGTTLKMLMKVALIREIGDWCDASGAYLWYDWYDIGERKFTGVVFRHAEIDSPLCAYTENYLSLN